MNSDNLLPQLTRVWPPRPRRNQTYRRAALKKALALLVLLGLLFALGFCGGLFS